MTYINVPLSDNTSLSCGQKTLKQILAFKNDYLTNNEILNLLDSKPKENIDIPSIAIALNKRNIKTKLYLDFSKYINKDIITLKDLKEYIKTIYSEKKLVFLNKLLKLAELNSLELISLKEKKVINLINKNIPNIVIVNSNIFSEGKNEKGQHIIIINGITDSQCIFTSSKMFKKGLKLSLNSIISTKVPCLLVLEND
jgi:hypothetical protein